MALDIDDDVGRKITKFALIGYVFLIFLSPAQPLLCFTLMGLLAIAPILLGPNPLRILGLIAFAASGYLFWPEFQESKKVPARNEVRLAVARADPLKAAVVQYLGDNKRLPGDDPPGIKLPTDDKAAYEFLTGGVVRVQMKFAPLAGLSLRLVPVLSGGAPGAAPASPAAAPPAPTPAPVPPVAAVVGATAIPASGATDLGAASDGAQVQAAAGPVATAPAVAAATGVVGKLSWQCISDDIVQSYLPRECRNSENLRKAAQMKK